MKTVLLGIGLILGCATAAQATVVHLPGAPQDPATQHTASGWIPPRGATMADVVKHLGAPLHKHPTVGGHHPHRPPVTRWDYPNFSIIFERKWVIDTVRPAHPPKLYHTNQLQHGS